MLSIAGVARDGAGYYVADPGRELPAGFTARWIGAACARAGLEGAVDGSGFRRLLQGCHPVTGLPLGTGRSGACWIRPDLQRPQVGQRALRAGR